MHSAIYEGRVRHRRRRPVVNCFRYPLFMVYLDLSELDTVFADHPLWSVGRPNVAYLRRADHLGSRDVPLDEAVRREVETCTGQRPDGPIRLLTHLRYFGHCFNPVSFFYCYDADDTRVETILAEVCNTPWRERHIYALTEAMNRSPQGRWRRYVFAKGFHVSPFMDMDQQYDWRFREPGDAIRVHMDSFEHGVKLFDATLTLHRREITPAQLTRALLRYPAITVRILAAIHYQALRLWWKGARFYVHPRKRAAGEGGES